MCSCVCVCELPACCLKHLCYFWTSWQLNGEPTIMRRSKNWSFSHQVVDVWSLPSIIYIQMCPWAWHLTFSCSWQPCQVARKGWVCCNGWVHGRQTELLVISLLFMQSDQTRAFRSYQWIIMIIIIILLKGSDYLDQWLTELMSLYITLVFVLQMQKEFTH